MRALAVHDVVVVAGEVTFRPLDFDHACACVGQVAGTMRRRHGLFDGNDQQAF